MPWPDSFIDWSRDITTEEVDARTLWRFQHYPFLWDNPTPGCQRIAGSIAEEGRRRAFQLAAELQTIPGYFRTLVEYKRWLLAVAYREALRLLSVYPDFVEVFENLGEEKSQLLRYLYLDQFPNDLLATALGLLHLPKPHPGVATYRALCDRLRELGWAREDEKPFPEYPGYFEP